MEVFDLWQELTQKQLCIISDDFCRVFVGTKRWLLREMEAFVLRQGSWLCLKRSWRGHLVDAIS